MTEKEATKVIKVIKSKDRADSGPVTEDLNVEALEQIDLTAAQKTEAQSYQGNSVIVFNREVHGCRRGSRGKVVGVSTTSVAVEVAGRIRRIPRAMLDRLTVCRPVSFDLCAGDKLQLKANANAVRGEKLANGEIVTVAAVTETGVVKLADGRALPPTYRQFLRGYAVTSYGSQGKTVDHVLFSDSTMKAATNAEQWYVTISRGRLGIRIFTSDKTQLRESVTRSGQRALALDLMPLRDPRRSRLARLFGHGLHRVRDVAAAVQRHVASFTRLRLARGPAQRAGQSVT